jgi:hypothetical protein
MEQDTPQNKQISKSNFSQGEKQYLKSKFFELGL